MAAATAFGCAAGDTSTGSGGQTSSSSGGDGGQGGQGGAVTSGGAGGVGGVGGSGGSGGMASGDLVVCVLNEEPPNGNCQDPAELDFGFVSSGTEETRVVRIDNDTGHDVDFTVAGVNAGNFEVTSVRFEEDPGDPQNLLRVVDPLPVTRSQASALWFEVKYTANGGAGPLPTASLRLQSEDVDGPIADITVPIKGEQTGCPPGSGACDADTSNGCETNTNINVDHCGGCFNPCDYANAGATCNLGQCEMGACNLPFADCDMAEATGCESNLLNDALHCGACAISCVKANTQSFCNGGNCNITGCLNNYADCNLSASDGCETNVGNTLLHCGGCNLPCAIDHAAESCIPNPITGLGQCVIGNCEPNFRNCDNNQANGCESDSRIDVLNCNTCGHECLFANAAATCASSTCVLGACNAGFDNCDNNAITGCEANLGTDPLHCGNCATNCNNVYPHSNVTCSGTCQWNGCQANFWNIDQNLANGCEYACTFSSATDLPDNGFVDANCDGIDGSENAAVFVASTGNDINAGTKAAPMATLAAAMGRATTLGRTQIYVSEGIYTGRVTLTNGISIYGGYSAVNGWARSASYIATIRSTSVSGGRMSAVEGSNITTPTTLDRVTIETFSTNQAGVSNYGLYCNGCTALTIKNSNISAGQAGGGTAGSNGGDGNDASANATTGGQGACDSNTTGPAGGPGATSTCGRTGGTGGKGGDSPGSHAGGMGGTAVGGTTGGTPGGGGDPGGTGIVGNPGNPGTPGTNGSAGSGGSVVASFWVSATGGNGFNGTNGNGGGGGGGGGSQSCFFCDDGPGNAGGGGGAGGCAGGFATAGSGGGGSFGMFLVNSNGLILSANTIAASNGGNGGTGGRGGDGGDGSDGASGGTTCTGEVGRGGNGGNGGDGGRGGHGGGGAGGPSYGIYRVNSPVSTIGNTFIHASGGNGGTSPGNAGIAGAAAGIF